MTNNHEADSENEVPLPSHQPLEVDFIEHRNEFGQLEKRPSWKYHVERRRFVNRPILSPSQTMFFDMENAQTQNDILVKRSTENFATAVEALKVKKTKNTAISNFDLRACHDWGEVVKVINNAELVYRKDDTVFGKVRKAFRRVGENAQSIQTFIGMLPDGEYKTLCGGLTLILSAMMSHAEIREKVADLMDELPHCVNDCEAYRAMYPGKNTLQMRVNELYVELLMSLEDIVHWYMQSSRKRISDSLLKNSAYSQKLELRIKAIRKSKDLFQREIDKFLHWRTYSIAETGDDTNAVVHDTRLNVCDIKQDLSEQNQKMGIMVDAMNGCKDVLGDVLKNAKWQGQIHEEAQRLRVENERKDRRIKDLEAQLDQLSHTPESLASLLSLDLFEDSFPGDARTVQSVGLLESIRFQDRSRWVAEAPTFREWLDSSHSKALFIQAYSQFENISPLSFLVSLLHDKLKDGSRTLVLNFFCGLHGVSPRSDDITGPTILARAVFTQLLSQSGIDWKHGPEGLPRLSFLKPDDVSELKDDSYDMYLHAIAHLILGFQDLFDAIFIVIDGIDLYELRWQAEIKQLIKSMTKSVKAFNEHKKEKSTGTLKVLFTVSSSSGSYPSSGKSVARIDMPEDASAEGDGFERLD